MTSSGGIFRILFDTVCDFATAGWGLPSPPDSLLAPKGEDFPKREDRAPYPPDGAVEILPPINEKESALKRQAADREFWEML